MKKQTNRFFANLQRYKRTRAEKHRGLRMEMLEGRRLMAADTLPLHNGLIATDVNKDFTVSPLDALLVINALHKQSAGQSASGEGEGSKPSFVDVSGDGIVSPLDALLVINELNAEGEGNMLVSYTVSITDTSGNPISQVSVGDTFTVRVFVQDIRAASEATGVFSAGADLDLVGSELESNLVRFPALTTQTFLQGISPGSRLNAAKAGSRGADSSDEEFNEVNLLDGDVFAPPLPDRDPPIDPTRVESFFSANFVALKPGTISFAPNAAETAGAETLLYDDTTAIPTGNIMYSSPVSITIVADATAPVAVNDTVSTPEGTSLILAGAGSTLNPPLTQNDTVTAPRTLTVTAVNVIAGTTQGTVNGLTYIPPTEFNGQDRVTYTVTDSNGLTSTATVTINVTPVNDPPTAAADTFTIEGDSSGNLLDVLENDSAGPNETEALSITAVSAPNNGGTVTRTNNNTALLYSPAAGFDGTETFTYTVTDGQFTSTATVTITVEPGVRPFARRDTATIAEVSAGETGSVSIDVLANDLVNPGTGVAALLVSFAQPANGTVTLDDNGTPADASDDELVYVPDFEFNGTDTFTYVMNDTAATGENSTGTVTVTVTDVNDAPTAANDTATGTEDQPVTIAITTLLANDSPGLGETNTQTLSITSVSSNDGDVVISGTNVVFTPDDDLNGPLTFSYVATDSGSPALTATAVVTVTLTAQNDPPVTVADNVSTNEDTPLVFAASTLAANDSPGPETATDEDSQTLTVTAVAKPAATLGTVSLAGGNITYSPAEDFNGTEIFTYTVQDSAGATATGTVTVTVNAINDAPEAGTDSVTAFKGVPLQISVADLLANDSTGADNEGSQTLSITAVSSPVNGTVSLNAATGIITFTPAADFSGAASFQYTVQDNGPTGGTNQNSSTGTVNVSVQDFIPTDISGTVWVDETNDGVIDSAELRLGGVEVTLTGNSLGVPIAARTYITLADGSYHFDDLGPGQYVVRFQLPTYMIDGRDVAGRMGDADSVNNQFTINVAQPGGSSADGYNFATVGVDASHARQIDLLASRFFMTDPSLVHKGLYAALGADNTALWMTKLDGFDNMVTGEAVLNAAGNRLQLTMVDANQNVYTASLTPSQFVVSTDRTTGNRLVRVLADAASINFQQISLAAPPVVSINRYLEAIDEIFAQEGWSDFS